MLLLIWVKYPISILLFTRVDGIVIIFGGEVDRVSNASNMFSLKSRYALSLSNEVSNILLSALLNYFIVTYLRSL